jgi:uncharacterized protein DUF6249
MNADVIGVFIPILLGLGAFAMVFGLRYLNNKENMAMIEKGLNPKEKKRRSVPNYLKWGMLLTGVGAGLFLAYLLDNFALSNYHDYGRNVPIYFALIAIGGGLGLVASYRMDKKEFTDKHYNE